MSFLIVLGSFPGRHLDSRGRGGATGVLILGHVVRDFVAGSVHVTASVQLLDLGIGSIAKILDYV